MMQNVSSANMTLGVVGSEKSVLEAQFQNTRGAR